MKLLSFFTLNISCSLFNKIEKNVKLSCRYRSCLTNWLIWEIIMNIYIRTIPFECVRWVWRIVNFYLSCEGIWIGEIQACSWACTCISSLVSALATLFHHRFKPNLYTNSMWKLVWNPQFFIMIFNETRQLNKKEWVNILLPASIIIYFLILYINHCFFLYRCVIYSA